MTGETAPICVSLQEGLIVSKRAAIFLTRNRGGFRNVSTSHLVARFDRGTHLAKHHRLDHRDRAGVRAMNEKFEFDRLPPQVAAAVNKVMHGIAKLSKDENNPFGKYMYAGIESYLEMVRPLCAAAGLIVLQEEEGYELITTQDKRGETIAWLAMKFVFGLAHSSGETWPGVIHRTAMVQASMGSQAFGAAQSYALKSFLRSLGMIATGDTEDADSHQQRDLPSESVSTEVLGNRKTLPKTQSRAIYKELEAEVRQQTTLGGLNAWYLEARPRINTMHPDFQKFIITDCQNRKTAIEVGADEEGRTVSETIDDEIPEPGASG